MSAVSGSPVRQGMVMVAAERVADYFDHVGTSDDHDSYIDDIGAIIIETLALPESEWVAPERRIALREYYYIIDKGYPPTEEDALRLKELKEVFETFPCGLSQLRRKMHNDKEESDGVAS